MSCIPDIKTTEEMYSLYCDGYSLSEVGKSFGVSRQTVYTRFKRANKSLRKKKVLPYIIWDNCKYTIRNNGYYAKTDGNRTYLHRDVWIKHNGNIPPDLDVHHVDENKTNNKIENLILMSKSEHTKHHGFKNNQYTKK